VIKLLKIQTIGKPLEPDCVQSVFRCYKQTMPSTEVYQRYTVSKTVARYLIPLKNLTQFENELFKKRYLTQTTYKPKTSLSRGYTRITSKAQSSLLDRFRRFENRCF